MDNCCGSSSCCETFTCPICNSPGQPVPFETVKSMVCDDVSKNHFGICLDYDCDVVYFSSDVIFRKSDVIVPIAWKKGASPKYICYCNKVTEDEIISAVVDSKAQTVSDVARITGAMKNGRCLLNNPKGTCCHNDIENIIRRK